MVAIHARNTLAAREALGDAIGSFRKAQLQLALAADMYPPSTGADQMWAGSLLSDNALTVAEEVLADEAAADAAEMKSLGSVADSMESLTGHYLDLFDKAWELRVKPEEAP